MAVFEPFHRKRAADLVSAATARAAPVLRCRSEKTVSEPCAGASCALEIIGTAMDASEANQKQVDQAVAYLRQQGTEPHRIALFERYARAGSWHRARKVLSKEICGAQRRHGAGVCMSRPLHHGRCRWHGGGSPLKPGPRTSEGLARCIEASRRYWRERAARAATQCESRTKNVAQTTPRCV